MLTLKDPESAFLAGAAAGAIGVGVVGAAAILLNNRRHHSSTGKWKKVGRVDQLWVHPLKGGRGKSVMSAECQELGLRAGLFRDRTFGIIKDNSEYASTKEHPRISLIELVFHEGQLRLRAPGKQDLSIDPSELEYAPQKELTIRMLDVNIKLMFVSEECNRFVSDYLLGLPSGLRLVFHYSSSPQRPVRPKYRQLWSDTLLAGDAPALNYSTAYTILTWPSMHALNNALEKPVSPDWFRSNILVATDSDEPFQEDNWTGRVRLGKTVELRYNKPCNRCAAITVDPETGEKDPELEPLKTLRSFRLLDPTTSELDAARRKAIGESPLFAVNYSLNKAGFIEVGDDVFVEVV